jgi:hypothetical protein
MRLLEYHEKIRDYLLSVGVEPQFKQDGRHPYVQFEWAGKTIRYTVSGSPSDNRHGSLNAIHDLRRILGNPAEVEQETKERRSLAEMLPHAYPTATSGPKVLPLNSGTAPKEDKTFSVGGMSYYPTKPNASRLSFRIPLEIVHKFGKLGDKVSIKQIADDMWELGHTKYGPSIRVQHDTHNICILDAEGSAIKGLPYFGRTKAEYTYVDGKLLVALTKPVKPYHERKRTGSEWIKPTPTVTPKSFPTVKEQITDYKVGKGHPPLHTRFQKGQSGNPGGRAGSVMDEIAALTAPTIAPVLANETWVIDSLKKTGLTGENLRAVLVAVRYIEQQTPYRISRNKEEQVILVAPRIE